MAPGITASASGSEYLLIVPDGNQNQAASTNVFAVPIAVSTPNVKLATAITSAPSSAALGQTVKVSWTVTNNGTATAAASFWQDNVYLSRSPTLDSSATYVGGFYYFDNNSFGTNPGLAPGGSYQASSTFTVPAYLASGSYYVIVKTDNTSYSDTTPPQGQSDTSGNVATSGTTLTATATGNVDLVVTSATAPTTAVLGSNVAVSFTVKNQGTDATGNTWTDAVFLSDSPTLNASSTLVTTLNNVSSLGGGASYTANQTFSLPTSASAGNRYLVFVTNSSGYSFFFGSGEQSEVDTTNDFYAVPIALTTPDLAVTAAAVTGSGVEGSQVTVSWTVQNQGSATAATSFGGAWSDGFYLSDTPVYNPATATLIGEAYESNAAPLAAQGTYSSTQSVTLPSYTLGNRYLLVVADAFNSLADPNRANNVQAVPITLTAPNLAISNVSVTPGTSEVDNQATLNLSWTVTNTSSIDASTAWTDAVYLSSSAVFDPQTAVLLTTSSAPSVLAAGANYTTTLNNVSVPTGLAAGSYSVFFVANANVTGEFQTPQQPESNPADDILSAPLTLTLPSVNLQVSNVKLSSTSVVGSKVALLEM
jgi:hypothetical protein